MSATLSSVGTWSTITGMDTTSPTGNVEFLQNLNFESLKSPPEGVIWPELVQFATLVAAGYGIQFWQAVKLIAILMRALQNQESVPDVMVKFP